MRTIRDPEVGSSAGEGEGSEVNVTAELLSVISHELRSPLNALLGWNRILAMKRSEDPEVANATLRIEQSARAQLKIVNDLFDLGQLALGKFKICPRPMKLSNVLADALERMRPLASAKGLKIAADLAATRGELNGDPQRLGQVAAALLSNAIKFTGSGGRIELSLRSAGTVIEFTVADTGKGIAPQLLEHVFDRFRRGQCAAQRSGGLGLGLMLSREIVTLHGGSIEAMSEGEGCGTVFTVRLPARSRSIHCEAATGPDATAGLSQTLCGLSILVVDDDADARTVIAETLRLEGARVTVSDSAAAALSELANAAASFDVLVSDIGMPVENGFSLVRKLRSIKSRRCMLAVALTGYASKSDADAALAAGFDLHVAKPVDFDWFVPAIRHETRRRAGAA